MIGRWMVCTSAFMVLMQRELLIAGQSPCARPEKVSG